MKTLLNKLRCRVSGHLLEPNWGEWEETGVFSPDGTSQFLSRTFKDMRCERCGTVIVSNFVSCDIGVRTREQENQED